MESTINSGDTTWVLVSTALVMIMTPALASFKHFHPLNLRRTFYPSI